jgi:hypothetical protein
MEVEKCEPTWPKLMLRWRRPLLCFFFLGSINACAGDGNNEVELSYLDVEPIIQDKCLRCHGDPRKNGAPVSFTTYGAVYDERIAIEMKIRGGDMPPTYLDLSPPVEDLSSSEREMLLDWLDSGAPQ